MDDVGRTLLDLERRGWDSLCTSTGDRFYGDIMTADGLMVLADGTPVYTGTAYREDDEPPFVAIMSSVYQRALDREPQLR